MYLRSLCCLSLLILALPGMPAGWVPEGFPPAPADGPALCVGRILSLEEGAAVLDAALARFPDRESWETYIVLARMGAVVLAIDMFGFGDSIQVVGQHAHGQPAAVTIQSWNAIRAVDFLLSLERVDRNRVGVSGESGGGTQSGLVGGEIRIRRSPTQRGGAAEAFRGPDHADGR